MKEYIRFLEEIAGNGHVALNVMQYDGWLLRFSKGYTCRANSVSVLYPSQKGIEEKVAYCEACYAKQGQPAIFKVTDPDTELTGYLLKRGYSVVTPTDVMVLDLEKADLSADTTPDRKTVGVLRDGTKIVRNWHDREYEVVVRGERYEYNGKLYRSLSGVARAITGTNWNGNEFFGIKKG